MREPKLLAIVVICALTFAACARKPSETLAVNVEAESQSIRNQSAEWLRLMQASEVTGIVTSVYTKDALVKSGSTVWKGIADISAGMKSELAESPDRTIEWNTRDVHIAAAGDSAFELGTFTYDSDGPGDAAPSHGEYFNVWRKWDGTWRVAADVSAGQVDRERPPKGAVHWRLQCRGSA